MPTQIDTVVATPGDLHSGSSTGLTPPNWSLKQGGTFRHNPAHKARWRAWLASADRIKEARSGKRLVVVMGADLIDGDHHNTKELITKDENEQAGMATEAIDVFLDRTGFTDGDMLYFLEGTESHVGEYEDRIARDFDAIPYIKPTSEFENDGRFTHPELKLNINGKEVWFAHQFLRPGGRAWTTENSVIYGLKDVYFDRIEKRLSVPDLIISHHFHKYVTATFERNGHTLRGVVCPPMQNRNRFARRVAPLSFTTMGVVWHIITAEGAIVRDQCLLEAEEIGVIKI